MPSSCSSGAVTVVVSESSPPVALTAQSQLARLSPLKANGVSAPTDFPLIPTSASPARPQEVPNPPTRTAFAFDSIEDAIAAFARGEFLVVMDDEGRENEGDLIVAGSALSTQKMAWMIKHTRYVRPCLRTPRISQRPPA